MKRFPRAVFSILTALTLCAATPTFATITFLASSSNPTDNGTLTDSAARAITPPTGMQAGDFVYLIALVRTSTANLSIVDTGGQSWTAKAQQTADSSVRMRVFTTRFNGTWTTTPTVQTDTKTGVALTLVMSVFRPTNAAKTWAVDVAQATNSFTAPTAPFDVTASGQTAVATSTVTVATFVTANDDTWALQTSGWLNPGGTSQVRNTSGNDTSASMGYRINTAAGATGSVTDRQTSSLHNGRWVIETFAEAAASADTQAPTVPAGLGATAASSAQINLSWTASTDNVAVASYLIERCAVAACSNFVQIGAASGTTYSDAGLDPSTTYRYQIRAQDGVPNVSGYSSIASAATSAASANPVAYWKLDEASGTTPQDSSGNANHCTMSPAPAWTSGIFNGALTFDGVDDIVNCGTGSTLGTLPAITVSAWVNLASVGESGFGRIVQKGDGGNPTAGWRLVTQGTNQIEFTVDHVSVDAGRTSAVNAFAFNTWTHIAATWTGSPLGNAFKIYVNGPEVSYASTDNGTGVRNSDSASALRIGNNDLGAGTVNGKIDEVRVYNRVLSASEIQTLADATAPSAPSGLGATAASSTQINLSWTASTDNVGVTEYRIERCQGASCTTFAQVGTASGTTYNDPGLTASTTYRYQVRAADANSNLSGYSSIANATTQSGGGGGDTQAPTAPSGLGATAASATAINLSWTASTDNVGVAGYRIERCQGASCTTFAQIASPTATSYSDTGRSPSTTYRYQVRAVDAANNLSAYSNIGAATTPADGQAPTAPSGLAATAFSNTQIDLTWTASTDNVAVTGYLLERCLGASCTPFALIASPTSTSYSDTGLTPSSAYRYRVRATDAANNLSGYSNIASATTPADTQAPTAPAGLTTTAISNSQINLSWTASTDDVGVSEYRVERCQGASCTTFAQVATPSGTAYSDAGLNAATSYSYRVRAADSSSNLSSYSSTASATTQNAASDLAGQWKLDEGSGTTTADASGSGHPGALNNSPTWTTGQIGGALSFNGGTTAVTISGGGSLANLNTNGMTVMAWVKTAATPTNTTRIVDKDNASVGWFLAINTTSKIEFWSDHFSTIAKRISSGTIPVNTWKHVAVTWSGSTVATNIHLYINGTLSDGTATNGSGTASDDSGTPLVIGNRPDLTKGFNGTIDEMRVYNRVLTATEIQTIASDSVPPSAPAGLAATATSSSQINLSWTASADNIGVTNYLIERCQGVNCSSFAQIATVTGTTYNNTGLSASTAYSYRVRATDVANNYSAYSSTATATTQSGGGGDTTPPTTPTNLAANAASGSQVNLSWTASTDNVGVTGYRVERCQGLSCSNFAEIATPTGTTYNDPGLSASTSYSYRVRATDAATNLSGYSNSATASTLAAGMICD